MAICELPPESLLESVGAKILKARRKRARKIALPKKTAANMGTSGKGGQSGKEGQDMEPSEQEKDQSKHSGEDGTYVNAIPREKRNQVMAVDPRALLQRTDAGSANEVPDAASKAEASSSNATLTSTKLS